MPAVMPCKEAAGKAKLASSKKPDSLGYKAVRQAAPGGFITH